MEISWQFSIIFWGHIMTPVEVINHYILKTDAVTTLGAENDFVSGGSMTPFELDRRWVGDHYEQFITTPAHDGKHTINLGAGDDYLVNSSGDDIIDGGAGLDMIGFQSETFYSKSSWEYMLPYPDYFVTVNLKNGTAKWTGRDITEVHDEAVFKDGSIVDYIRYAFPLANFGGFSHSLTNIEAVRGTPGDDRLTGSDAPWELFDLSDNGNDKVNGAKGEDWVAFGHTSGILFDDLSAVRVDLEAGTVSTRDIVGSTIETFTKTLSGIEHILGSSSKDILSGDDKDNKVFGGFGDDTLDGRGGKDTLYYELDFSPALLKALTLSRESLYGSSVDTENGVTVNLELGTASDTDGNDDTILNFENVSGTSRNDILIGDGKNNLLTGLEGDDTLVGGKGSDKLDGGDGADTLTGGKGKDEFILDGIPAEVDTITDFQFGTDFINYTPPAPGGSLSYAGVAPGSALPSAMMGLALPSATMLLSTLGKDLLVKSGDSPLFKLSGDGFKKFLKSSVFEIGKTIVGTDGLDDLKGTNKADFIYGLGGIDGLSGGGGNDFLSGGDLDDGLYGGKGNDTLLGGDGRDILNGLDGDNRLYGGEGFDFLTASTGNDILDGGPEFDRMHGGGGKDIFVVSDNTGYPVGRPDLIQDFKLGVDKIDLSGLFISGRHLVQSDLSLADDGRGRAILSMNGPFGSTEIAEINFPFKKFKKIGEKAFLDSDPFIFTGGPASIVGSDGKDTSTGTKGNDVFFGGRGFDALSGKNGNDILDGGDSKDTLVGGQGADQLFGGAGNDHLDGGADDDILQGDSGKDTLTGGTGNDNLFGGADSDTLIGGDGDDFLSGGTGKDILTGGNGSDHFHFGDFTDRFTDKITDFELGVDRISVGKAVKENFKYEITDNLLKLFSDDAQTKPFLKMDLGDGIHDLLTGADLF